MRTRETTTRTRALTVLAVMATALVGVLPASAVAQSGSASAERHRGYVCDRVERHHSGVVGSSRCRAFNAPRHGTIRGSFTIQKRGSHHLRWLCVARHNRPSGYANTPNWVRGEQCRRI